MLGILLLTAATAAASVLLYAFRLASLHSRRKSARLLYGCQEPVKYPNSDLATLRSQALKDGRLKMLYLEQHRTLGETWQESFDGKVLINTISGANLQYMYALHPSNFPMTVGPDSAFAQLFGYAGFLVNGDERKWTRKLVERAFASHETSTTMMPMLKTHVDRFMDELPRDGCTFDAQPLIKALFLDLSTEFIFGEPLGMQIPSKRLEGQSFLQLLDSTLLALNKRRRSRTFSWNAVKQFFDRSYAADIRKVHAYVDERVQKALAQTSPSPQPDNERPDISNANTPKKPRYIVAHELARRTRDPKFIRSITMQTFLPGRDNTAILLSNTLWALARHPSHWTRLRPLALSLSPSDLLSSPKLSSLHPIRNVIFESLRMYGPGGGNRRLALSDDILPEGGGPDGKSPLFVPAGATIQTHLPVNHRNKRYWGDDADEWRPERFEGRRLEGCWYWKPFLAGPRVCPAKDLAVVQATYVVVRLLREFDGIENRDEVVGFEEMVRMTTESRRGARIGLIEKVERSE